MALTINPSPILEVPNWDNKIELHEACANAAQLYKKKSNPEDSAMPMAVLVAPPIALQDRKVEPGGESSATNQVQSTGMADLGKSKKGLSLNVIASALQFSGASQFGKEASTIVPPQLQREQGTAQPVAGLVQSSQLTEFTSVAKLAAQRMATAATVVSTPVSHAQFDLSSSSLAGQMTHTELNTATEFTSSTQFIPSASAAETAMQRANVAASITSHVVQSTSGTPAESMRSKQAAQIASAPTQNMALNTTPNTVSNLVTTTHSVEPLPSQATPQTTTKNASGTPGKIVQSQQARVTDTQAQNTTLNTIRNAAVTMQSVTTTRPTQVAPAEATMLRASEVPLEFTPPARPAQVVSAQVQNMEQNSTANTLRSTVAKALSASVTLPSQAAFSQRTTRLTQDAPAPATMPRASEVPLEFTPPTRPAEVVSAQIQNMEQNSTENTLRSTVAKALSGSVTLPSQAAFAQATTTSGVSATTIEFPPSIQSAQVTRTEKLNTTPNIVRDTAVTMPSGSAALPSKVAPMQAQALSKSGTLESKQSAQSERTQIKNIAQMQNTTPNVISSPVMAMPSASAGLPLHAVSAQITIPLTSNTLAQFTPTTQPAQVALASTQSTAQNTTRNTVSSKAAGMSTSLPSQTVSAQNTTQNMAVLTLPTAPVTTPQTIPMQGTTPETPAQLGSGKEVELVKTNSSLSEKSNVQSMKQELSEITSALPTITISGQPSGQISPIIPQEQPGTTHNAAKTEAKVIAKRDDAETSKETTVSLLGGTVTISGTSETGTYKLRTSDKYLERIVLSHDGEIPAGITSVKSSTDKDPEKGSSTNKRREENTDE